MLRAEYASQAIDGKQSGNTVSMLQMFYLVTYDDGEIEKIDGMTVAAIRNRDETISLYRFIKKPEGKPAVFRNTGEASFATVEQALKWAFQMYRANGSNKAFVR